MDLAITHDLKSSQRRIDRVCFHALPDFFTDFRAIDHCKGKLFGRCLSPEQGQAYLLLL